MITEAHKNWFDEEKGITSETLEAFNISSDEGDWVVFPYAAGDKKRYIGPGDRKFVSKAGIKLGLFHGPLENIKTYAFLVEGETDTMRLWQEGIKNVYGTPGLFGVDKPEVAILNEYDTIFVVLDNDADYNVAAKAEQSWRKIRTLLGIKARRVVLPDNVKDIVEFFGEYTIETFRSVAKDSVKGKYHYSALDLSVPPPDYRWLVDGLICTGDTTLMVGEPNVGKSWVSLSLAVAMCDEHTKWLGYGMSNYGKVLYVDEENPHDLVYHRLKQLGLVNHSNLRYLHRQGIRLDRNFDHLLDEAITYQPKMIVLDSLTRFHTQDENNAGAMACLFNDSINVLSRETGAAVIILHHTNKSDSNSSYIKTRGSSDIGAAVDGGIELRKTDQANNTFNLVHFKSRRTQAGGLTKVQICDTISGQVELVTTSGVM